MITMTQKRRSKASSNDRMHMVKRTENKRFGSSDDEFGSKSLKTFIKIIHAILLMRSFLARLDTEDWWRFPSISLDMVAILIRFPLT